MEKFGNDYSEAFNPVEINDKLAFIARKNSLNEFRPKYVVVYDGKEFGNEFASVIDTSLVEVNNELAFVGEVNKDNDLKIVVVGDKKYGPYNTYEYDLPLGKDGHVVIPRNNTSYIVDGKEYERFEDTIITEMFTFVQDDFFFGVSNQNGKNEFNNYKAYLISDGVKIATMPTPDSGPYNIDGKLAYVAVDIDGVSQLFIDKKPVGPRYPEDVLFVSVSKGGKVAIKTESNKIYINGELIKEDPYYINYINKYNFKFIEEEPSFFTYKNDDKTHLWYKGRREDSDFMNYRELVLVNNKLVLLASSRYPIFEIKHYLISEE